MERSRRETAGKRGKSIGSSLAALRMAREGGQSRTEQWEAPSEAEVFREVDEDEYRKIVEERRQREDFVVDDDGLGYYDDGEEHLGGEAEDAAKGRAEALVRSRNDDKAARKARKLNAQRKEKQNDEGEQQAMMWRYLEGKSKKGTVTTSKKSALDNIDGLIDAVGSSSTPFSRRRPHRNHTFLETSTPSRAPVVAPVRNLVQYNVTGSKTTQSETLRQSWARTTLLDDNNEPPPSLHEGATFQTTEDEEMPLSSALPMEVDENTCSALPPVAIDQDEEHLASSAPVQNEEFTQHEPEKKLSPTEVIAAARARLEAKHGVVKNPVLAKPKQEAVKPETPSPPKETNTGPSLPTQSSTQQHFGERIEESDWLRTEKAIDEDGKTENIRYAEVYWLDASVEGKGTVYLTGKALVGQADSERYVSCCVQIRGTERNFFVLPRIQESTGTPYPMGEVYAELKKLLDPIVPGSRAFKCKQVRRKYAFGDDSIPREETDYLKIKYDADLPPPPKSACEKGGRTYAKILAASTPILESFVTKRKLMGPCWLRVHEPQACTNAKVSHCILELRIDDPKLIVVDLHATRKLNRPPPPLTVTTLSVKTVINPKNRQHEIVAAVALTRRDVALDTATSDGGVAEDYSTFALDTQRVSGTRRWTMAAVRPLGQHFVDAGLATSTKLPRDFDQERAQPAQLGASDDNDSSSVKGNEAPTFLAAKDAKCPNEKVLVSMLLTRLGADDPDVLCGHNILQFDLDIILSRAMALGLAGNHWSKLGRLKRTSPPAKWKNAQTGRDTFAAAAYAGRLICDTYASAKEHVRGVSSYSLASLATTQLGVAEGSVPTPFNDPSYVLKALASDSGTDVCTLLWHAGRDVRLAERLALRLQVLPLSKQLTAISGNLLSRTLRGHRAERIEYLLLHEFHRLKFIAPEKQDGWNQQRMNNDDEDDDDGPKRKRGGTSRKRAKAAYSGGLVLEPKKGFYDTYILLLDFASLYPSIIQEYDICFTTLSDWSRLVSEQRKAAEEAAAAKKEASKKSKSRKKKKKRLEATTEVKPALEEEEEEDDDDDEDDENDEADLMAPILEEELETPERRSGQPLGVLPRVLRSLIAKRREVKGLLKKERDPKKYQTYDIRQMALKLTANSMYGCLGFTHSRFYAKPLAALVTRLGRETLQATAGVAQKELGLEVIYGDTDSIMINTKQTDLSLVKELGNKVKRAVNARYKLLELELDGIFKSMLLLKKKKYAALVVKKECDDGTLELERETKGLDLVRRDWCELAKRSGRYVLDRLLSGDAEELVVADIHAYLEQLGNDARDGKLPVSDFIITKGLGKAVKEYGDGDKQPHVRVAKEMMRKGLTVNVGDYVPYVICTGPGQLSDKARHPNDLLEQPPPIKKEVPPPSSVKKLPAADTAMTDVAPLTQTKAEAGSDTSASVVTPAPSKSNANEMTSVVEPEATPIESTQTLELDADWYLKNQILQSIGRLCEPLELTSKGTLATKLGLDSRGLNQQSLAEALRENVKTTFKPQSAMSDQERFGACHPLKVTCASCAAMVDFPLRPRRSALAQQNDENNEQSNAMRDDDHTTPVDVFACPHCKSPAMGTEGLSACWDRVSTAIKLAIAKYQGKCNQHWKICDDCHTRTRQKSEDTHCPVPDCSGTLLTEYPQRALYTQLKYFEALFDIERCPGPPDLDRDEVIGFLKQQVTQVIEALPYNYIQPSLFAAFAPK